MKDVTENTGCVGRGAAVSRGPGGGALPCSSDWRTAPLWGLNASDATGQPLHLLHDGRARSIQEAILWHGGAATASLSQYLALEGADRDMLDAWIAQQ